MPRLQVYVPDELHREIKRRGLPASSLLQHAVAAELRRLELEARADGYVDELIAEVGMPSEEQLSRSDAVARRMQQRANAASTG